MKKTMFQIYAFAVCFFAVVSFVITLGLFVWDVVQVSAPKFTLADYAYRCYQSDDAYRDCYSGDEKYVRDNSPLPFPRGAALTEKRETDYAHVIFAEKRRGLQGMARKAIVLLINVGVFLLHWRLARRERDGQEGAGAG